MKKQVTSPFVRYSVVSFVSGETKAGQGGLYNA